MPPACAPPLPVAAQPCSVLCESVPGPAVETAAHKQSAAVSKSGTAPAHSGARNTPGSVQSPGLAARAADTANVLPRLPVALYSAPPATPQATPAADKTPRRPRTGPGRKAAPR